LHFDVDVIADFHATNYPGSGGLSIEEVREALLVFVQQKHLAAIEVTAYNPTKDPDGRAAKMIVDLLAEVLAARLEKLNVAAAAPAPEISTGSSAAIKPPAAEAAPAQSGHQVPLPSPEAGESWSSDSLDTENEADPEQSDSAGRNVGRAASSGESDGSSS
jgi:arginase family protein